MEINGGEVTITTGQTDTDCIEANGGTVNVTGQSTFDYDGVGQLNCETVIVNGQQVTRLPLSME